MEPKLPGRSKFKQPFASSSIWNLPLGANASYVATTIAQASSGSFGDENVIILTPNEPLMPVYLNNDGWTNPSPGQTLRCASQGDQLTSVPIPASFYIPGSQNNDTPNNSSAVLMSDARTLRQMQPLTRCQGYNYATALSWTIDEDIYGDGISGLHGGSGLSSIGGTIRLGELLADAGPIAHALQLVLNNTELSPQFQGKRWPATNADGDGSSYTGGTPALRMGSLLALQSSFDPNALQTISGKKIAQAMIDYGAYVVDTTGGWSAYYFTYEFGPDGSVKDEMTGAYGYSYNNVADPHHPFSEDIDSIVGALWVIDNWDEATFQTVKASAGAQGAGGGAPRQPWAPAIVD